MRYLLLAALLASTSVLAENTPHPILSEEGHWVPIMLIIVGGLFLAAAVIGPVVRANMEEEIPPPAHSHDEPPGASHHHGASGTLNPSPDHDAHHH